MREPHSLCFGPFRLDLRDERLWRDNQAQRLTHKAFAVLRYLVERAERLVTKDELLDAVWATRHVSEAAMTACIREIRLVLDDEARAPRFLETVRGRGYRFVASTTSVPTKAAYSGAARLRPPGLMVGREAEMTQLRQHLEQTLQGDRQVMFIKGEAGIGKTALLETFVHEVTLTHDIWVCWGQCIDQYGAGEPYLPLLDALGQLLSDPQRTHLLELMEKQAPSWLLQLPTFVSEAAFERLQRRTSGSTRERMLRELAEVMDTLTVEQPLVMVLEDLRWSDASTLDWLAYAARRRQSARLLVLDAYRPVDAVVRAHPVRDVIQELNVHGYGTELALDYLSEGGVAAYLGQRLESTSLPKGLVQRLYQKTNGNPLFLRTMVDMLVSQRGLPTGARGEELWRDVSDLEFEMPGGIEQLITHQLERLTSSEQACLEAASVVGKEFATEAVAACLGVDAEVVEDQCETWARRGQFVQSYGAEDWPNSTVSARYRFIHGLYHEVVYARIGVSRRSRWHQLHRRAT